MATAKCIWCGEEGKKSAPEHIIPESLAGPNSVVLDHGEVCTECNNGLAFLDQAVGQEFDLIRLFLGVPGKRNRVPRVDSRGNVKGSGGANPFLAINNDPTEASHEVFGDLAGYRGHSRNLKATLIRHGDLATVQFDQPIAHDPKFRRGLVKMAIGLVALKDGPGAALHARYKNCRKYVLGTSVQPKIWVCETQFENLIASLVEIRNERQEISAVILKLFNLFFFVELFPDERNLECKKNVSGITELVELDDP